MADQGDPKLFIGQIGNLPAKKSCNECCFRRDSPPGCLGGYTLEDWKNLLHARGVNIDLACHCSTGFNDGIARVDEQRTCTGYAKFKANAGHEQTGKLKEAMDFVGEDHEEVFSSWEEFERYHSQPGSEANRDLWKEAKSKKIA